MDFTDAIADGLNARSETLRARQKDQRSAFLARFPRDGWSALDLDDYALNTPEYRNSYSYFLEWGTPDLGSISGGSAHKHVIFKRNTGEWAFPSGYSSVDEAWRALRDGFVQMFDLAANGEWTSTSEIDILRGAKVVRLKSLFLYFPDHVLPIYSHSHLNHFATQFGLPTSGDAIDVNRRVLQHLRQYPELSAVDPLDFISLLYSWSPPPGSRTPKYWKIAPGPKGSLWDECLAGGYIAVGWDDIGDLSLFATQDDFKEAFAAAYTDAYNGSKSAITQKGNELWRMMEIAEGDRIIANRGTSEILGVGIVASSGYQWRPERAEYKHTINVDWDTSLGRALSEPVKRWATTTIVKIPATVASDLLNPNQPPQPDPADPAPSPDDEDRFTAWKRLLDRKGQVIFYGPPGTGKTYAAKGFARWLLQDGSVTDASDRLTEVTFHASYAYEDFIEGFRPRPGESELKLELRDGIMKRVAKDAAKHPDVGYVIIIDEINRADVPRVFGELMTVVESSRRGQSVTLPTSGESLTIPPNVTIIGTMNTADQSIRTLDAALRRRFGFIELMPDTELLADVTVDDLPLDQFLENLNARITQRVGRERQIGHSYFLDQGRPIETAETFAEIVRTDIVPLLQEVVYDDYGQLQEFLGTSIVDAASSRLRSAINDDSLLVAALADHYRLKVVSTTE